MVTEPAPTSTSLTVELNDYDLTWGALRAFVSLGRHMPDSAEVEESLDQNLERRGIKFSGLCLPPTATNVGNS